MLSDEGENVFLKVADPRGSSRGDQAPALSHSINTMTLADGAREGRSRSAALSAYLLGKLVEQVEQIPLQHLIRIVL